MKIPILERMIHRLPRRMRLSVAIGLVAVTAVVCSWWARHRDANVPWHRVGGMIGWTQPQMIARIGQPAHLRGRPTGRNGAPYSPDAPCPFDSHPDLRHIRRPVRRMVQQRRRTIHVLSLDVGQPKLLLLTRAGASPKQPGRPSHSPEASSGHPPPAVPSCSSGQPSEAQGSNQSPMIFASSSACVR